MQPDDLTRPHGGERAVLVMPPCPVCDRNDQVAKVSTIYLTAIGINRLPVRNEHQTKPGLVIDPNQVQGKENRQTNAPHGKSFTHLSAAELKQLSSKLKPPASPKQAFSRPVHPDTVILTFSLVVPFFLFGVIQSQSGMIIPMVAILIFAYALYFWKRKKIILKFNQKLAEKIAAERRIQRALERWMNLYYCARDEVIFEPGKEQGMSIDLIHGYLMKE
jgi:hypothetical protein